jgi:calcineurin-like phosphoesterase family protein
MDAALVKNWNEVVEPRDEVYILGDLAYCCDDQYAADILFHLNGVKRFIEGNHDEIANRLVTRYPKLVRPLGPLTEIKVEGQKIVLCHYSLREWHHALRGVWHLFGHTHSLLGPFGKSVDVGIDNVAKIAPEAFYRPVSFAEVKAFMDARPIGPHPGFSEHPHK